MGVGLEERVLHRVFGVFAIARNVHGQAKDLGFVTIYEFFKRVRVAAFGGGNEEVFVVAGYGGGQTVGVGCVQ